MTKIIALVGCSSAGKDFIMNSALEYIDELKPIISHTSRPPRKGEIDGVAYNFISEEQAMEMFCNGEFIEKRLYNVANNETWLYGIHKDSIELNKGNKYIVIVDLDGLEKLEKYYRENADIEITSIYIDVPAQVRLKRSLDREGQMTDAQVEEIIRRFIDDETFVAKGRAYCDYCVRNSSFYEALKVIKIIEGVLC